MGKTDNTEKNLPSPPTEDFDGDSPENYQNKTLEPKGDGLQKNIDRHELLDPKAQEEFIKEVSKLYNISVNEKAKKLGLAKDFSLQSRTIKDQQIHIESMNEKDQLKKSKLQDLRNSIQPKPQTLQTTPGKNSKPVAKKPIIEAIGAKPDFGY
jgi:hypothetical protein